jgi:hypothetical protein
VHLTGYVCSAGGDGEEDEEGDVGVGRVEAGAKAGKEAIKPPVKEGKAKKVIHT